MANDYIQYLKNLFNIGTKKDRKSKEYTTFATRPIEVDDKLFNKKLKYPQEIQKFYDYWLNSCSDTNETLKHRFDRYKDLDFMYYNGPLISSAVKLYADETTQADSQDVVIHVKSESQKFTKYVYSLFKKWGLTQDVLQDIALDIALYGDSFTVNNIDDNGVSDIVKVDVRQVKDRIEFSPSQISANAVNDKGYSYINVTNRNEQLRKLGDVINDKNNISAYYKNYLFGYEMSNGLYMAPWSISHYRLTTSKSEFYPFGRPLMINAIAPFRKWYAIERLVATARSSKFPKEKFDIKVDETMTGIDQWEVVNEAKEEYHNVNQTLTNKEEFGVGGQIWVPQDLMDYSLIENNMRLDDISDLEESRNNLAISTGVPVSFLVPGENNFGTTGISLTQQYKPFGRSVFKIQSVILNQLVQLIRVHLTITEEFDPEINFNLSMNYPTLEQTSDRMRMKSDSFRLATDIISGLSDALGLDRGESLPIELVMKILASESYLTPMEIDDWIKVYKQSTAKDEIAESKVSKRMVDGICEKVFMQSFRNLGLTEGTFHNIHYVNSSNATPEQTLHLDLFKSHKQNGRLHELTEFKPKEKL